MKNGPVFGKYGILMTTGVIMICFLISPFLAGIASNPILSDSSYTRVMTRPTTGTIIKYDILENRNFTLDGSPYIFNTPIYQFSNIDLNIDPGVEIVFWDNGSLLSDGNINAFGTPENRITFRCEENMTENIYHVLGLTEWTIVNLEYCEFIDISPIRIVGTDDFDFYKCDFYGSSSIIIDNASCGCPFSEVKNMTVTDCNFYDCPAAFGFRNDSAADRPNFVYLNDFYNSSITFNCFYNNGSPISYTEWMDPSGFGNYWSDYEGEDQDGDGTGDTNLPWKDVDWNPLVKPKDTDSDSDGIIDLKDNDDDNDGYLDAWEAKAGTDLFDSSSYPHRPEWSDLPTIELSPENESVTLDLADYASDEDVGDTLTFTVMDYFDESIQATIKGSELVVDYIADAESTIWVRVTDNVFDADANISVIANITGVLLMDKDKDDDGLPDAWEEEHFGSLDQGFEDDQDLDGLSNLREYEGGTDPTVSDITDTSDNDEDGLLDSWEILCFSNLDSGPEDDNDGDGFSNLEEYNNGTDPTILDIIGDDDDDAGSGISSTYIIIGIAVLAIVLVIVISIILYLVVFRKKPEKETEPVKEAPWMTEPADTLEEGGQPEGQMPPPQPIQGEEERITGASDVAAGVGGTDEQPETMEEAPEVPTVEAQEEPPMVEEKPPMDEPPVEDEPLKEEVPDSGPEDISLDDLDIPSPDEL